LQGSVDSRREQALEGGIEKPEMGVLRQDRADFGNEVMNEHSMNVLSKLKPATSSFGGNKKRIKIAGCIFRQKITRAHC
jgi:hypothetical protein